MTKHRPDPPIAAVSVEMGQQMTDTATVSWPRSGPWPGARRRWLSRGRRAHGGHPTDSLLLHAAVVLVVVTAPIEGYLIDLHPQLGKLPAIVLMATWAGVRIRQRRVSPAPVYLLLAGLAGIVLLSTATHLIAPFSIEYAIRWLPFLVVSALLIDIVATEVSVRVVFVAALAGASIAAVGALISVFVSGDLRAAGPLEDPNDLAYVLTAALPLATACLPAGRTVPLFWRLLPAASAVLLVAGAAVTLSRGGLLAVCAAALWLVARRNLSLRAAGGLCGAVVAVAALVWLFAGSLVTAALGQKTYIAESNIDQRLIRWRAAIEMAGTHPVLGVGPGGFRSEYLPTSHVAEIEELTPVTHNMYLEVAAELGIIGFALFIALIVGAFVYSERALRLGADRRGVVATQAALLAVVVSSVTLSEEYYLPLWSMIAVAYALHLRASRAPDTRMTRGGR